MVVMISGFFGSFSIFFMLKPPRQIPKPNPSDLNANDLNAKSNEANGNGIGGQT
jgi:hypothetical protein